MNAFERHALPGFPAWNMVSEQDYLAAILRREMVGQGLGSPALLVPGALQPLLQRWGNRFLLGVTPSGSYAKGTANHSATDLDLFISLSPDVPETLKQIHEKLEDVLRGAGYTPRPQNVSIGIKVHGYSVDLVPGKLQNWLTNDHSLYKRRGDTWTKTDVSQHINKVLASGRQAEIRLTKLWRSQQSLEFPSFYLELAVIKALEFIVFGSLADNIRTVFGYLRDNISTARFIDPSNTNNIISDDLTVAEKQAIKLAAIKALSASYWRDIIV